MPVSKNIISNYINFCAKKTNLSSLPAQQHALIYMFSRQLLDCILRKEQEPSRVRLLREYNSLSLEQKDVARHFLASVLRGARGKVMEAIDSRFDDYPWSEDLRKVAVKTFRKRWVDVFE
jgi:hypothetical protein